jgi:hypothetical protein
MVDGLLGKSIPKGSDNILRGEKEEDATHALKSLLPELFEVHLIGDVSDEIRLFSDPANESCFECCTLLDYMLYFFLGGLDISIYTTWVRLAVQLTWVKRFRSTKSCSSGSIWSLVSAIL